MINRRDFMKLAAVGGGAVFLSGLSKLSQAASGKSAVAPYDDFFFVQLSDTHWGYQGPANPEAACPYSIDTSALVTKELVLAFALLGLVALIPVALKKWKERYATA